MYQVREPESLRKLQIPPDHAISRFRIPHSHDQVSFNVGVQQPFVVTDDFAEAKIRTDTPRPLVDETAKFPPGSGGRSDLQCELGHLSSESTCTEHIHPAAGI